MLLEDLLKSLDDPPSRSNKDIDSDTLASQIIRKNLESKRYESDTKDRKWLAIWAAMIVTLWLLLVMGVLVFNEKWFICLNDNVLITLLGTTTLNVLGLSFIVLRGNFSSSTNA